MHPDCIAVLVRRWAVELDISCRWRRLGRFEEIGVVKGFISSGAHFYLPLEIH